MNKPTLVAAALAAGLTSFVPHVVANPLTDGSSTMSAYLQEKFPTRDFGKEEVDKTTTSSITKAKSVSVGSAYDKIIARHAAENGIPVALAHAVVRVESNYRANARGSAGEIGLMQIKPATARMMGYSGSAKGLYDPDTNIRFGMKYLAKAHQLGGGDTCGTILRYNAGHAAKRMNRISAAYCAKVKRHLGGA
ncbi:lytic transglycosylase domain-containing protein [Mesorhizobium sp. CAU 1741]|uniref:lytic transglycosylase domain-containing protein n=1 Tax=Mesorhizobium sp. CAU 1741 TaxID=3140366 RepID=UPI00325B117E